MTARHIPWLFVAGFAIVIAVNATMIWLAVGSFSGLYTTRPRDRGLHYNEVIAEQQHRDQLGWRIETQWRPEAKRLELALFDAAGRPLAPSHLSAELVRPVEKRQPLDVTLAATDVGRFAATVELPERGNWDLDIRVERDGERYAVTRRMFLR
ncbi:MAG: FixH family protein [Reyranella sp.]|jgi:nitrogen fixation protein FixH|nr:FixH family protein [Reyranella sp.]MBL6650121.1 FixH family protein [Reyranella sp.]